MAGDRRVPGGPLTEAAYRKAVEMSGFTGIIIVWTHLLRAFAFRRNENKIKLSGGGLR